MFTLLRNFRTMFMLTVANYNLDAPSGPTEAELKLAEAAEISESTREKLIDFQAAMNFFAEDGATLDKSVKNTNPEVSKDLQELLNLASIELDNEEIKAGEADGWFGGGTESAVKAFQISQNLEPDGIVTVELYSMLESASGIVRYKDAIEAAEALAAQEAADERQSNLQIVAGFDWENRADASEDDIKALQQALQDLGKPVNTIDGVITPGGATEREFNAIQDEVREMELDTAEANLTAAQERLTAAQDVLDAIRNEPPMTEADLTSNLQAVDDRIAELIREADSLGQVPHTSVDSALAENEAMQNELLDMQDRLAQALNDFQNGITPEDTAVNAIDTAVGDIATATEDLEEIQQDIADQADVYSRLEMDDTTTTEEFKELLKNDSEGKLLLCQLQADLKILGLYSGAIDGHRGIDYGFGSGTETAFEKAIEEYGSITAIRRAAKMAEVVRESEINTGTGRTNQGIDLVAQNEGYQEGDLEAFLAERKCPDNMPEDIKNGTPEAQQAWIIAQAIEMGDRENADKSRLTLIDGLSQAGNDRIIEVMKELRVNFETIDGQAEIIQAMSNGVDLSSSDFENGEVGTQDYEAFELGGRIIDTGLLDSAYIATGSDHTRSSDGVSLRGTMEVPIWNADGSINEKFAELDFANATYINGAIVMTVKNGCEGNLVIIPVQREKYVPPVVPPRRTTSVNTPVRVPSTPGAPGIPEMVIVPEDTPDGGVRRECDDHGNWVATTWEKTGNTILFGLVNTTRDTGSTILIPNADSCNGGNGGGDNNNGGISTTTGTEGAGATGSQEGVGAGGSGNTSSSDTGSNGFSD